MEKAPRRGAIEVPKNLGGDIMNKISDSNNHSNQLNPNNDAYWQSRGDNGEPDDWEEEQEE